MVLTTTIFGLSHLSVRIPVLIGSFIYLLSCERLCRHLHKDSAAYALTLLVLTINPFILDYMVVARGYSLALGFFMTAFLLCLMELRKKSDKENEAISFWKLSVISCLCTLSVASNLAFAFINTSLLGVFFIWLCLGDYHLKKISFRALSLAIPGAVLFLGANSTMLRYNQASMFYGAESWDRTYQSIIDPLFDGFTSTYITVWRETTGWFMSGLPVFFGIITVSAVMFFVKQCFSQKNFPSSAVHNYPKAAMLVIFVLLFSISLHSFAYLSYGILLPLDRTGIYFVPLVILLVSINIEYFTNGRCQKIIRISGRVGLLICIIYFLSCLHLNYFRHWSKLALRTRF